MAKRSRDHDEFDEDRQTKRTKHATVDRLSRLSDEVILRVLAYLPVSQLVVCQRLSRKYHTLAGDGQIWKAHYYNRFVRPRASRLPGLREFDGPTESLHFASKASKWLEDEHLVDRKARTDWKRQYKLRHNWSRGSCVINELQVAEQAPIPPALVQMHDGLIYTVDREDGLRVWAAKGDRQMIAHFEFSQLGTQLSSPTALAVESVEEDNDASRVAVGFEDGSFSIIFLKRSTAHLRLVYGVGASNTGMVSAMALKWPYVMTMTATQRLSLYQASTEPDKLQAEADGHLPHLIHSLKSHTAWPPLSISLRVSASAIVMSVAYALPTYLSGWTVGIQEVRVSRQGHFLDSRVASAIDQHYRPLAFSAPPMVHHITPPSIGALATSTATELRHIHLKPTSLSYTHPYLLVTQPDNTLTLYLVTSTAESLSISAGSRLWGHTSSVSGAHVGGRGKAVSVSRRGDELRVWELEGGFASSAARKRLAGSELSVRIRPEEVATETRAVSQAGLDLVNYAEAKDTSNAVLAGEASELTLTRGWIGFDDESVVVLKERSEGRQTLVIYDFT